jgi:hypothetical protein
MSLSAMARKAKEVMDPIVAMVYFVPEGPVLYEKIGLKPRQAYFITRSAAFGVVPGEVVAATFYNFNPALVVPLVNEGWQACTPAQATQARNQTVVEGLTRLWAEEDGTLPDVSRAVELVKKACSNLKVDGRPLFAAHYGQAWADENPLLSLWWGCNLLREFRGDGHIAVLLAEGISGLECTLIAPAWTKSGLPKELLFKSRAWSEEQMAAGYAGLQARGILDGEALTEKGQALRDSIEERTDQLALAAWKNLGEEGTQEFLSLITPLTKRILERGGLGRR